MDMGIGILGSGFMGRTWAEVARRYARGARLSAVAGGRRSEALAKACGVPLEGGLDGLLRRDDVQLVVLATPPDGHAIQAVRAAAAGRHVLVEKPMAPTLDESRRMVEAADAGGVRLGVVSHQRFRQAPLAARDVIDGGVLGGLRMIRVTGAEAGWWDMAARGDEWKRDPRIQTAYASWGAHACDLLCWYLGRRPVRAWGTGTSFGGYVPNESVMGMYEFDGGALASVWMTYETPQPGLGNDLQFLFVGSDAMLELDVYGQVRLGRADGWEVLFEQTPFDKLDPVDPARLAAYARHLEDMVRAAGDGRDPEISGRDGMVVTAMLEGMERSMATGLAVDIDVPAAWTAGTAHPDTGAHGEVPATR